MSDTDSEQKSRSKSKGASKRGRRRSKKQEPAADQAAKAQKSEQAADNTQVKAEAKPEAGKSEGKAESAARFDESGKVSSLLETTGEDVKQLLKAADEASKKIREASDEASGGSGKTEAAPGETGSLVQRINSEVQQVLETADDAADKIREEARSEARQVIVEARRNAEAVTKRQMDRVKEMTDNLLGELAGIQGRMEQLQRAYDQAMRTMNAEVGVQESQVWETKQNGEVESDDEAATLRRRLGNRPRRRSAPEPEEISEGARLLALQQMMAGVDPKVIEGRLRNEFGIDDPKPILDWMGLHGAPAAKKQQKKS